MKSFLALHRGELEVLSYLGMVLGLTLEGQKLEVLKTEGEVRVVQALASVVSVLLYLYGYES